MFKPISILTVMLALLQTASVFAGVSRIPRSPISEETICTSGAGDTFSLVATDIEGFTLKATFESNGAVFLGNTNAVGVMELTPENKAILATLTIEGEGRFATLESTDKFGRVHSTSFTCE